MCLVPKKEKGKIESEKCDRRDCPPGWRWGPAVAQGRTKTTNEESEHKTSFAPFLHQFRSRVQNEKEAGQLKEEGMWWGVKK